MKMKSMATGLSMAVTIGTIAYAVSKSSKREKHMLKSSAGKALHAMGDVADVISEMIQ